MEQTPSSPYLLMSDLTTPAAAWSQQKQTDYTALQDGQAKEGCKMGGQA